MIINLMKNRLFKKKFPELRISGFSDCRSLHKKSQTLTRVRKGEDPDKSWQ